jgi:hypothetical protein
MNRDNALLLAAADDDPIGAFRGLVNGTALSLVLWIIGGLVGLWLAGG